MSTTAPVKQQSGTLAVGAVRDLLEKATAKLAEVAPKYLNVERVTRLLVAACTRTPKILECSSESILQFAMKCAETGLEPIGAGGCWPVPYGKALTFIPDYRGLGNCAKRAGCITSWRARVVRESDEFEYEEGTEPRLFHKPARKDRGALEAAYCVCVLPDGTKEFTVMEADQIQGIRRRSKAANNGPWVTDEEQMWAKTVVRRAMKPYAGMSPSLDAAIESFDAADPIEFAPPEVPMPKAIGEATNGDGKHVEEAPQEPTVVDALENQAAEAEAAERMAQINQLRADIGIANKTWELQVAKHWGGRKWDALTPDEQAKEIQRLEALKPVEAN